MSRLRNHEDTRRIALVCSEASQTDQRSATHEVRRELFLNIHAPGMNFAAYLREVVAVGAKGAKSTRELFERHDMHVLE